MASATLAPYKDATHQESFNLVASSTSGSKWIAPGRSIGRPYSVEINRRFTQSNAKGNDLVDVIVKRVEANTSTTQLATCQMKLSISIPKDVSVLTPTVQKEMLSIVGSLLNEQTAMEATSTNVTALIEGRDL